MTAFSAMTVPELLYRSLVTQPSWPAFERATLLVGLPADLMRIIHAYMRWTPLLLTGSGPVPCAQFPATWVPVMTAVAETKSASREIESLVHEIDGLLLERDMLLIKLAQKEKLLQTKHGVLREKEGSILQM
jgi:hypothetical protein